MLILFVRRIPNLPREGVFQAEVFRRPAVAMGAARRARINIDGIFIMTMTASDRIEISRVVGRNERVFDGLPTNESGMMATVG